MSSDRELVSQCLEGNPAAMRELIHRFEKPVYSLCYRMLQHHQDAEDIAQESLVRMCRHLKSWDASRQLLPWVLAIAANRCRTALAKRKKRPVVSEFLEDQTVDREQPNREISEELDRAIQSLREEYRVCFILFYQQEMSVADISATLDVPVGTIKTWLHRARKMMAQALRDRGFS